MSLKIGVVGIGKFAQNYGSSFKAHPLVSAITLGDLNAARYILPGLIVRGSTLQSKTLLDLPDLAPTPKRLIIWTKSKSPNLRASLPSPGL